MVALRANHVNFYFSSHQLTNKPTIKPSPGNTTLHSKKPWQPKNPNQANLIKPTQLDSKS